MEYVTIERPLYDAMVRALKECHEVLLAAKARLHRRSDEDWIDSATAQAILCRSARAMQSMRADGQIRYSLVEGKVYHPASEIGHLLDCGRHDRTHL